MNIPTESDKVTIVRKKGDDYEIVNVPVRQSREATIARLKKNPGVAFIMEDNGDTLVATAVLADDAEMKVTLIDGDRPEGRVDITTVQHEDRSAGVYVSFHGATSEDYDDIFNSTMEYAMHMYENRNDFSPTRFASSEDGEMAIVFIMQAREIMEDAGFPVEGFLAADVIFEPFTFEHNGELVLLGSEHFNGYSLYVEVKRLFIGATDAQKDEVAKKAMEGNDIEAIHCADASWSFRKPLCITDVDLFTEELLETVDTLLQAIGQVGEEPDGDEPRKEILRQMFTWEVLDAVAKYNQLPM